MWRRLVVSWSALRRVLEGPGHCRGWGSRDPGQLRDQVKAEEGSGPGLAPRRGLEGPGTDPRTGLRARVGAVEERAGSEWAQRRRGLEGTWSARRRGMEGLGHLRRRGSRARVTTEERAGGPCLASRNSLEGPGQHPEGDSRVRVSAVEEGARGALVSA